MTINEVYQDINLKINNYLTGMNIECPVIQYGVDPANLKTDKRNIVAKTYPYFQSSINNIKEQAWTSNSSGIYTKFDYQLSFFTAPENEYSDDLKLFYPFEVVKNALSDVKLNLLKSTASITGKLWDFDFKMKSGQPVPAGVVIYKMIAVCSYVEAIPEPGGATNIDSAINVTR